MFTFEELKAFENHDKYAPEYYLPDPGIFKSLYDKKQYISFHLESTFRVWIERYQEHIEILYDTLTNKKEIEKKLLWNLNQDYIQFINQIQNWKGNLDFTRNLSLLQIFLIYGIVLIGSKKNYFLI